jgi:hypothetical protein
LNFGGISCAGNQEIWNSLAPKKCKIFAWLALYNHLSTKERWARRGVTTDARCSSACQTEGRTHILFLCPHTSFLWRKFNIQNLQGLRSVQDSVTNPRLVQPAHRMEWATIFIAITWKIWLARNKKVFDNVLMPAIRNKLLGHHLPVG